MSDAREYLQDYAARRPGPTFTLLGASAYDPTLLQLAQSQVDASGVKVPKRAAASAKAKEKQVVRTCFGTISTKAPNMAPL